MQTEVINQFLYFLENDRKVSENTIQSYKRDIYQFENYLTKNSTEMCNIERATVSNYIEYLQENGRSVATILRNVASIRSLNKFLVKQGLSKEDPTEGLVVPKIQKRLPQILTLSEIELLLKQPNGKEVKGARDKAMLELLYATGMRVSEMIGLDLNDIDLKKETIFAKNTLRPRKVPIGQYAKKALINYVDNYWKTLTTGKEETALFVNTSGTRLTRQGFWKIIKHYKNVANIEKEITPHTFRHSFAAHLIQNGADVKSLQEMLGHADVSSTNIYSKLASDKLHDVYKMTHPRA